MDVDEIKPLDTLDQLLCWDENKDAFIDTTFITPLVIRDAKPSSTFPPLLRTLICHDMKGGYLDDKFCSGSNNKDAYRFYHWSGVDTFVYFSHHLVTIPPIGWIQAAHLHQVKVLGTLITEWNPGADACKKLLSDPQTVDATVNKLVSITQRYKFDGWLINIENKIDSDQVDALVGFVRQLTTALHEVSPHCEVIWYDSVTSKGKLDWQNELNQLNRCFFDVCDGIFLNYTWTEDHLQRTFKVAGIRAKDVYVGVDVFGRNFYEGGGYNTHKALEVARKHSLSVGIFAQGWTYEVHGKDNFVENEGKLWRSLYPFLPLHGPSTLPFSTSFCQGFGENMFKEGKIDQSGCWHNLCKQQYQPVWSQTHYSDSVKMLVSTNDSFNGGSCLEVDTDGEAYILLFCFRVVWTEVMVVNLVYKWNGKEQPTQLALRLYLGPPNKHLLHDRNISKVIELNCEGNHSSTTSTSNSGPLHTREEGMFLLTHTDYRQSDEVEEMNSWSVRKFYIKEESNLELKKISLKIIGSGQVKLGKLSMNNISKDF